ncbi:MAG: hypothetical protein IPK67_01090 [Planctomycetes bacterium]|nr:hypothetical protein [Planctomycetota bacterium]
MSVSTVIGLSLGLHSRRRSKASLTLALDSLRRRGSGWGADWGSGAGGT